MKLCTCLNSVVVVVVVLHVHRNEVQRWTNRTNQLIEQYNKVDPEEYKKLL